MKLHLPKMLTAALLAAITAVGSSAFADDAELTTYTTTNLTAAGTTKNYNAKGFAVVLNGPRLATTPTDVPITTCDLVYLNSITLGSLRTVPAAGVTLALADATGKVLSVSNNIVSSAEQPVTWNFSNTAVATDSTLYFYWLDSSKGIAVGNTLSNSDLASWTNAGNGTGGVSDYNGISGVATDNTSCGYLDSLSHIQTANIRFAPKLTIVTSGPVPQNEYTWKATGTTALWDEETANWTLAGADSSYTSDPVNIVDFNAGEFAMNVTVSGSIEAAKVNVNDNYQFTVASGSSLTVDTLSVAADKEVTVAGEGSIALTKVALANGATINVGAAASLAVTVADDADDTAIKATKDITLTSLAGPAEGKELTISAEGHTVAVQSNNTFAGDLVVAKGTVKLDSNTALGSHNATGSKTITIGEGATMDVNGKGDAKYVYTLAGGTLTNNGTAIGHNMAQTSGLVLTADSYIGGEDAKEMWVLAASYGANTVDLAGYKLTKKGSALFGFANSTITEGTLQVDAGTVQFNDGGSVAADIILNGGTITGTVKIADDIDITAQQTASTNATLSIADGMTVTLKTAEEQTLTLSNGLTVGNGEISVDGTVTVSGKSLDLSSGGEAAGTVSVLGNSVLNVGGGMWMHSDSSIELAQGGTVNIAGLSIVGKSEGSITATAANQQYSTTNDKYTIANADITATADVTIGNTLDSVLNVYTGAHTVTLNAATTSVHVAKGGTINIGETGSALSIDVADGGAVGSYVKADNDGTIIYTAGTAILNSVITLNAGELGMNGTFNVDALAFQGEQTIAGGEYENNGFATEEGTLTVVTVGEDATLTADSATVVRGGHEFSLANNGTAALNSTNYSAFYITNQSETVTKAKSKEAESHVTLASIHVDAGAELTVDQNINLSLVTAETGAKLNILSGQTVSVGDATTTATIAGAGTYALKSGSKTMTGTLAEGSDWTGTVVVSNVGSFADINLNTFGHEGSKVKFDGVTGHFGPHIITYAPELVLGEGGLTLNNGYSTDGQGGPAMVYTFAGGVSGTGNMTFNRTTGTTVSQQLVFSGDVSEWSGTLSVVARFNVTAHYIGVDKTVNSTISRTGGDLHVKVGTGEDASVVTFAQGITASDLAVLAGATAYINGGLTTNTITVGDGATLAINGNTTLTSAITSAGTVTLTNVALSDAFTESQGGEAKYYIGETQNYYMGSADKYLTVVTGDGAANATGTGLTWNTRSGLEMANGQVITGAGEADYSTLYVAEGIFASDIIEGGHYGDLGTIKVTDGGILTVDQALTGITIEVTGTGVITGKEIVPTDVQITKDATAVFTEPVQTPGVRLTAADDGAVKVTNNGEAAATYSEIDANLSVEAKTLEMVADEPVMVFNELVHVDEIINNQAGQGLTLMNAESLELKSMTIAKDAVVSAYYTEEQQIGWNEGTVTITESLVAGGGTLYANLTLVGHKGDDLLSWNLGGQQMTLGSTLTLDTETGLIQLDNDTMRQIAALTLGENWELVVNGGTNLQYDGNGWFDGVFSRTYTNADGELAQLGGDYKVQVLDNGNFGVVKYLDVPEPTTGTLSLLALAALAARRRKHN
ncbi:MAG: hypothetical protein MJ056_00125 [Akkermansia sp.]|nr:hypothetical protein [Akkermansia sp.]